MNDSTTEMTQDEELKLIRETLEKADISFVSTLENGKIVSRPLTIQMTEEDHNLWFLIQADSSIARQIAQNPNVNIAVKGKAYLSVSGVAYIVPDQSVKEKLWDKANEKFFGVEVSDPSVVAVKVIAESAEYWHSKNLIKNIFKFLSNEAGEGEADAGERNKVKL